MPQKSKRKLRAKKKARLAAHPAEVTDPVQEGSEESFPASDAPAWTSGASQDERRRAKSKTGGR